MKLGCLPEVQADPYGIFVAGLNLMHAWMTNFVPSIASNVNRETVTHFPCGAKQNYTNGIISKCHSMVNLILLLCDYCLDLINICP